MYQRTHTIKEFKGHKDIADELKLHNRYHPAVTRIFAEDSMSKFDILNVTKNVFLSLFPEKKIKNVHVTPESFTITSDKDQNKTYFEVVAVYLPTDNCKCAFMLNKYRN